MLNISIMVVARSSRILATIHETANEMFNMTIRSTTSMFQSCEIYDPNQTMILDTGQSPVCFGRIPRS